MKNNCLFWLNLNGECQNKDQTKKTEVYQNTKARKEHSVYNYFIRDFVPPPGIRINYSDFDINGPGVIIDDQDLKRLLDGGFSLTSTKPTVYEGILEIELATGPTPNTVQAPTEEKVQAKEEVKVALPEISFGRWDGNSPQLFRAAVGEVLLPIIKCPVEIIVPHGSVERFDRDDKSFRIYFWSTPKGSKTIDPPESIWGINVDCRSVGFSSTGEGVSIIDESTGYSVAELIEDRALYIHYDMCHHGSSRELKIFRKLLEKVSAIIEFNKTLTPAEREEFIRKQVETERQRVETERQRANQEVRQAYINHCSNRFQESLAATKSKLSTNETLITQLTEKLTQAKREASDAKKKFAQISGLQSSEQEKYNSDFDNLLSTPSVRGVQIEGKVIKVFTDVLCCLDPRTGQNHELGEFRIEIYTDGSNNGVRWFNLTRSVDTAIFPGAQAPHINKQGKACSNIEGVWPDLIANFEFSTIAKMAIEFVGSVDINSLAGKSIDQWPIQEPPPKEDIPKVEISEEVPPEEDIPKEEISEEGVSEEKQS